MAAAFGVQPQQTGFHTFNQQSQASNVTDFANAVNAIANNLGQGKVEQILAGVVGIYTHTAINKENCVQTMLDALGAAFEGALKLDCQFSSIPGDLPFFTVNLHGLPSISSAQHKNGECNQFLQFSETNVFYELPHQAYDVFEEGSRDAIARVFVVTPTLDAFVDGQSDGPNAAQEQRAYAGTIGAPPLFRQVGLG